MDARHEIGKWLNEQPSREIDRQALVQLCAEYDMLRFARPHSNQGDTCGRMCECTAYRFELHQLRAAVRNVMPENWREYPDWMRLVEAHGLMPNASGKPTAEAAKPL